MVPWREEKRKGKERILKVGIILVESAALRVVA